MNNADNQIECFNDLLILKIKMTEAKTKKEMTRKEKKKKKKPLTHDK